MTRSKSSLAQQMAILLSGRMIAFVFLFFLPVLLARLLTQEAFGLYRQFFLVFYALFTVMQLGMSVSLPAFMPRHENDQREILSMATVCLAGLGLFVAGVGAGVQWLGTGQPIQEMGCVLGAFTGLMIAASPFEGILLMEQKSRATALLIVLWDLGRGLGLLLVLYLTRDLVLALWMMVGVASLRWLAMLLYFRRSFQISPRAWNQPLLNKQMKEAGPLTLQAGAHLFEINVDRYLVMALFSTSAFAVYTVGAFQLPLVDMLFSSVCGVLLPQFATQYAKGEHDELLALYKETIRRMSLILIPMTAMFSLVHYEFIVVLFSDKYAESAPLFAAFVWLIPAQGALSTLVLQSIGHGRFLSVTGVLKPVLALLMVGMGAWFGGMMGIVLTLVLYHYTIIAVVLWLTSRAFDRPLGDLLPGGDLVRILFASLLAGAPLALISPWVFGGLPVFAQLVIKPLLFAPVLLVLLLQMGCIKASDKALARHFLEKLLQKIGLARLLQGKGRTLQTEREGAAS